MSNKVTIQRFVNDPSESNMDNLISLAKINAFSDEEICYLATCLAQSGDCLTLPKNIIAVDIPSTGGPSSLTTLICPLVLNILGYWVPKLGVRGRPAGGIDVLHQIPGYIIEFSSAEILECLNGCGYCHFLAASQHTPLDAKLFNYRSQVGATAIPSLVIASILAKKIAVGLQKTGLDVRVSPNGNFGTTWEQATFNSMRFVSIAKQVGIAATCFLSDNTMLQQPYVGRGEALLALKQIFENQCSTYLKRHFERCISMCLVLHQNGCIEHSKILDELENHFKKNIQMQNGSWDGFIEKTEIIATSHTESLYAKKGGFLHINSDKLKILLVKGQELCNTTNQKFSDSCGVIFKKMDHELVSKGDVILTFRAEPSISSMIRENIKDVITIKERIDNRIDYKVIK